jgi:hypothetical protein
MLRICMYIYMLYSKYLLPGIKHDNFTQEACMYLAGYPPKASLTVAIRCAQVHMGQSPRHAAELSIESIRRSLAGQQSPLCVSI